MEIISKNTLKKRRQRENIKKDHDRLDASREKDRNRKRNDRQIKKNQLKKHPRLLRQEQQKKALEMRKYRLKKQMTSKCDAPLDSGKVIAAKAREARKKDYKRKRDKTLQHSLELACRQREVRRVQVWRMRVKLRDTEASCPNEEVTACPFTSPATERRAVKKVKEKLPATPNRKARVLEKLLTPKTTEILQHKGVMTSMQCRKKLHMGEALMDSMKENLSDVKPVGGCSATKRTAYGILRAVIKKTARYRITSTLMTSLKLRKPKSSEDGARSEWWLPKDRQKRSDRIPETVIKSVREFYMSPEVSREVPDKRSAIKVKENSKVLMVARQNMTMTLEEAFKKYKTLNPSDKIGLAKFSSLRPVQVKKVSETNRRTCLCQPCCNAALKGEALKRFIDVECTDMSHITLSSKRVTIDKTLCRYETKHARAKCLDRTCSDCGSKHLVEHYKDILEHHKDKSIQWCRWEYVTIQKDDDSSKRIISCVTNSTTLQDFMLEYQKDMDTLPAHLFRSEWQHEQMKSCIAGLGEDEACLCMDYAENYTCKFQSEVQSAFFNQNQVTLHPMMAYYRQGSEIDGETLPVKHAIIGVTDDDHKDACGVKAFESAAITLIAQNVPTLSSVHEFTDGCAAQYKGKMAFHDVSMNKIPRVQRNFFETSHGKSVCDGLGAVVKGTCYQAVISGKEIICNATDLINFCRKKLDCPTKLITGPDNTKQSRSISKREFIFVSKSDVNRERPDCQTLTGTRKLHCVRSVNKQLDLDTRPLSCYCEGCNGKLVGCENEEYIEAWTRRTLTLQKPRTDASSACSTSDPLFLSKPGGGRKAKKKQRKEEIQKKSSVDPEAGQFVCILLKGKRKDTCCLYVAEVDSVEGPDVQVYVRYMERSNGGVYKWPSDDDFSLEPIINVLCIMSEPTLLNSRQQFHFSNDDLAKARSEALNRPMIKSVVFK